MKNPLIVAVLMLASILLVGCGSSDSADAASSAPKAKADPNQPPSTENAGGAKPGSAL